MVSSDIFSASNAEDINRKRRFIVLGAGGAGALALIVPALLRAETVSLSSAINRSGKLRALSQRIAKAYIQLSLGVLSKNANNIIAASQELVRRTLHDLELRDGISAVADALFALEAEAKQLIASTSAPAVMTNAMQVSSLADQVMAGAEKTTEYYESLSKSPHAQIVNVCGRQRMLSQRVAKCYMLIQAGHDNKTVRTQMADSRSQFNAAMEILLKAPISTPTIRQYLEIAKSQWAVFQVSLDLTPDATMMRNVATTSERVLELMDNLTNQYDQALKDMLGKADDRGCAFALMG